MFRYDEGKWTIKEVIGHLLDTERLFAYRLLRISGGDVTELPGRDDLRGRRPIQPTQRRRTGFDVQTAVALESLN
jgi:hypothetical protein